MLDTALRQRNLRFHIFQEICTNKNSLAKATMYKSCLAKQDRSFDSSAAQTVHFLKETLDDTNNEFLIYTIRSSVSIHKCSMFCLSKIFYVILPPHFLFKSDSISLIIIDHIHYMLV